MLAKEVCLIAQFSSAFISLVQLHVTKESYKQNTQCDTTNPTLFCQLSFRRRKIVVATHSMPIMLLSSRVRFAFEYYDINMACRKNALEGSETKKNSRAGQQMFPARSTRRRAPRGRCAEGGTTVDDGNAKVRFMLLYIGVCVPVHMYAHMQRYICIPVHMYVYTYMHTYVHMYTCACISRDEA